MKKGLLFLICVFVFGIGFSHEYILLAYKFIVQTGEKLEVHLFVADGFNVEMERPLQKSITKNFVLISENGKTDLLSSGSEGQLPVVDKVVDFKGLGLLHLERDFAFITLENEKFKAYLKEDHIENIQIDEVNKKEQKERYTRFIKALVQSNPIPGDTLYKTRVGQRFEILPLQNPYILKSGDKLQVQVFFDGEPLAGKMITARNRTGNKPASVQNSRTNGKGICSFTLNREGDWFVHATHMLPSPKDAETDWDSYWASYSFGMEK